MSCPIFRRPICLLVLSCAALAVSGCSKPLGSVSGKVMIDGKPVAGGRISFITPTGKTFTFNIDADGAYLADALPLGEMTVLVFGPPPPRVAAPGNPNAAKKLAAAKDAAAPVAANGPTVPAKYGDAATSDLRYTVTSGNTNWDPPLK